MMASPGSQHENFTVWAKEQGVKIHGVTPARTANRGLGIVAQRRIEVTKFHYRDLYALAEHYARLGRNSSLCPLPLF